MKKVIIILLLIVSLTGFIFFKSSPLKSVHQLMNQIVFIDPGHGGKDNGTSYGNVLEDEINLKLATIIYEKMINQEILCYLSRVDDYDLSSSYSKNHKAEDLKKRVQYIDQINTALFVSLHLNYYFDTRVNGLQVFYQQHHEKSYQAALLMQEILNAENQKAKQCKKGDYYILNNTKSTGILIEYGFLSSEYDRRKVLNDKYLDYLANLICKGIHEYLIQYGS